MDYSTKEGGKLIIKALRQRLYGNKDNEIERADKEELFYENLQLKQENAQLRRTQFVKPQLILKEETNKYVILEFIDSKNITRRNKIMKISSQYEILFHFIKMAEVYLRTQDLIPSLRPIKHHLRDEDPRKRVLDTIHELKSKFGNEIILKKSSGFLFFANIY